MIILRDDKRIARYKQISKWTSLVGFVVLIGGLALAFTNLPNALLYQFGALSAGWLLSQSGLYLAHRYIRNPRPDEVLDQALRKAVRDGRLYHYLLPAPHVLLTPAGPIIFVAKYQTGYVVAEGDKWRHSTSASPNPLSRLWNGMRRFFSQEGLGNPTLEAESMIRGMARYIHKHAPQVEEVPIGAIIVFTAKEIPELDVSRSRIPAMHVSKLRGYLKQQGPGTPLPAGDYAALREAFDQVAIKRGLALE